MSDRPGNKFERTLFTEEQEALRDSFRRFLIGEVVPHYEQWQREGIVPRSVFEALGERGFLCMSVPAEYGGQEIDDFRFNVVMTEECLSLNIMPFATGISLINDVALPYFIEYATPEQKQRWFPGMVAGRLISAIAMTEPSGGTDLAGLRTVATRQGDNYVLNGSKTFITNGINADLAIVCARTDPGSRHNGISLLVVERGMPGFERGRNLDKLGNHAQDTAELFFNNVRVPVTNLLGMENSGFAHMMSNLPQERLAIAISGIAAARAALDWTVQYVCERKAFGRPIGTFQANRMAISEMRTEVEIGQVFVDRCIELHLRRALSAEQAAMAKWWCTELQWKVVDRCLQLHGGYGYMSDFPIARAWADARVTRIYGGTNEIMKEIIGRAEGLGD